MKCVVCKKELTKDNGGICKTCLRFLEWKYKGRPEDLQRVKEFYVRSSLTQLNKSRRKKWERKS